MRATSALIALAAAAIPIGLYFLILRRSAPKGGKLWIELGTMGFGVLAYAASAAIEGALSRWSDLSKLTKPVDVAVLLYTFVVAAPIEQGLKVAAVVPVLRSRHFHEPLHGIVYASAAALGFISAHNAVYLALDEPSGMRLLRALLALPAHLFFAGAWGYALGRDPQKRLGGRLFDATWFGATLFNALYDHLLFARSPTALVAAVPMLLCMGVAILFAARDLLRRGSVVLSSRSEPWSRRGILPFSAPSASAMREALLSTERSITPRWIAFGALVTTGVITAMLAGAVLLGHRIGVDFAAVDRAGSAGGSTGPLVLLGGAALLAFPVAGYLIARASGARNMVEPALSAGLAIVGSLVLLGLAAPISVVFALAFAPIAFGLACAGAWFGMVR